jgi:hypothetical protein
VSEENKLRVFENGALRIFGPKSELLTGGWRELLWGGSVFILLIKEVEMGGACGNTG